MNYSMNLNIRLIVQYFEMRLYTEVIVLEPQINILTDRSNKDERNSE